MISLMQEAFDTHELFQAGWTFEIVDYIGEEGLWGHTNHEEKKIRISREAWPTLDQNLRELALHEVAHALCTDGKHDLSWWDTLMSIGGCGIWVHDNGSIQHARVTD